MVPVVGRDLFSLSLVPVLSKIHLVSLPLVPVFSKTLLVEFLPVAIVFLEVIFALLINFIARAITRAVRAITHTATSVVASVNLSRAIPHTRLVPHPGTVAQSRL